MSVKDNVIYQKMKVAPGVYVPDVGMDYPVDDPFTRIFPAPIVKDVDFDNYPYLDDSLSFKLKRLWVRFLTFGPLFLMNRLVYGIRFEGRGILKKYRKELADGAVVVCNHCYKFDGMAVAEALHRMLWIPMLKDHFQGPSWWLLTHFGGIPVPDTMSALKKFNDAFDEHNRRKEWILIFPEARSWLFYKPLKPFRKGAFTMAYKYGCPVLPLNISFRSRTGIHKLFGKAEIPLVTVKIGEPIFTDKGNPRKTEVEELRQKSHKAICELAGIIENPWPAKWNED